MFNQHFLFADRTIRIYKPGSHFPFQRRNLCIADTRFVIRHFYPEYGSPHRHRRIRCVHLVRRFCTKLILDFIRDCSLRKFDGCLTVFIRSLCNQLKFRIFFHIYVLIFIQLECHAPGIHTHGVTRFQKHVCIWFEIIHAIPLYKCGSFDLINLNHTIRILLLCNQQYNCNSHCDHQDCNNNYKPLSAFLFLHPLLPHST